MHSYILSIDIGSSNVKAIVMKMYQDRAELIDSILFKNENNILIENIILQFLNKYSISINEIEKIILVGSGSSYFENKFLGKDLIIIDEFDAIGIGGVILSKKNEGIVVNLGTGTTIVYSNINVSEYLIGTGLGGGCLYGFSKRLGIDFKDYDDLFKKCEAGSYKNVDLLIGDISKNDISILSKDLTAANFGAPNKIANENDIICGILNIITQNIGLLIKETKKSYCFKNNKQNIDIIFTGSFVIKNVVKKYFKEMEDFTNEEYIYVDDKFSPFVTCIGAYEYYLIKMREANT